MDSPPRYEEKLEKIPELEVCPKCGRLGKRVVIVRNGRAITRYIHARIRIKGKVYEDRCDLGPVKYTWGSPYLIRELGVTGNIFDNPQYDRMIENLFTRLIERMLSDKTPSTLRGELRRQAENLLQAFPSMRDRLEQAIVDHDVKFGVLKQRRVLPESEYLERKMNDELLKKFIKKRKT